MCDRRPCIYVNVFVGICSKFKIRINNFLEANPTYRGCIVLFVYSKLLAHEILKRGLDKLASLCSQIYPNYCWDWLWVTQTKRQGVFLCNKNVISVIKLVVLLQREGIPYLTFITFGLKYSILKWIQKKIKRRISNLIHFPNLI